MIIVCGGRLMKRITGVVIAVLGSTIAASAADLLPFKAPPPVAPFSWDGFYLGVNVGYGWGSNAWAFQGIPESAAIGASNFNPNTNHVLGGVQAGANYQMSNWVVGIEADVSALGAKGSDTGVLITGGVPVPGVVTTATSQLDWLALFTGRLGYAWDRTLFYAKGGVAAGDTKDNLTVFSNAAAPPLFLDLGTKDNLLVGWTVGAGIEYAFAPRWTAKIEYNYVDLGKTTENFNLVTSLSSITVGEEIDHKISIVKFGVNYRFF
jgi:outer membrane immunogenic protein